ncbi:MAG: hypothetical protein ACRC4W_07120 [Treponemataceae bacterium]
MKKALLTIMIAGLAAFGFAEIKTDRQGFDELERQHQSDYIFTAQKDNELKHSFLGTSGKKIARSSVGYDIENKHYQGEYLFTAQKDNELRHSYSDKKEKTFVSKAAYVKQNYHNEYFFTSQNENASRNPFK